MNLLTYLLKPETLIAVIIPLVFCVYALTAEVKNKRTSKIYWILFLIALPLTVFSGSWSGGIKENYYGLHIFPVFFILVCIGNLLPIRMPNASKLTVVALTYLNLFIIDLFAGYFPLTIPNWISFSFQTPLDPEVVAHIVSVNPAYSYFGVGGAGYTDTLFIIFVSTLFISFLEQQIDDNRKISVMMAELKD